MGVSNYIKRLVRFVVKGEPIVNTTAVVNPKPPAMRLDNRRVVVTGGGRGLGFSIAARCVAEGATVLLTGRNRDSLEKAASMLGGAKYLVLDMNDVDTFPSFFSKAEELLGGEVDSLVCNAGISLHEGDFRRVTSDGWDKQFDTNLKGTYFLTQQFVLYRERQKIKNGNVVVITSERAKRPDDIPYGLTKVACNSFVQAIARKVIAEGIRINAVAPGVTATDMTGFSQDGNLHHSSQAGGRIFVPEEISEVVCFLLDDCSATITGEVINCDHGTYITTWQ